MPETPQGSAARRLTDCCGHEFQTVAQRIDHERRVERGERVLCPCGDVCNEGGTDG